MCHKPAVDDFLNVREKIFGGVWPLFFESKMDKSTSSAANNLLCQLTRKKLSLLDQNHLIVVGSVVNKFIVPQRLTSRQVDFWDDD